MSHLQKSLREILQDQSQAKAIKICTVRQLQTFFSNASNEQKKLTLCRYFQRGDCSKASSCPYSHDKELLKQQRFKVQLCKNFQETGSCKFKDSCTFAHGKSQLRNK